mmetsp:Transcript_129247/g.401978  ORF Transcript_129247/g.401978 Transcript_129247/m.401978 type:complete len:252 (+) Transcript_129247:787-1542(+)
MHVPLGHRLAVQDLEGVHHLRSVLQLHGTNEKLLLVHYAVVLAEEAEEQINLQWLKLDLREQGKHLGVDHHILELVPHEQAIARGVALVEDFFEQRADLVSLLRLLEGHTLGVRRGCRHGFLEEECRDHPHDGEVDANNVQNPEDPEPRADVVDERPRQVSGPLRGESGLEHGVRRPECAPVVTVDPAPSLDAHVRVLQESRAQGENEQARQHVQEGDDRHAHNQAVYARGEGLHYDAQRAQQLHATQRPE